MNKHNYSRTIFSLIVLSVFFGGGILFTPTTRAEMMADENAEADELKNAHQALSEMERDRAVMAEAKKVVRRKKSGSSRSNKAEAFIAGPDWEFDGFVAGGQDARIKSMFVINDLIYLNIGLAQDIEPGDELSIYRRGDKIRDPQTGKFIGFEVRRAAVSEVTNKVDDETCAARILQAYEGVEIGDLVRRGI